MKGEKTSHLKNMNPIICVLRGSIQSSFSSISPKLGKVVMDIVLFKCIVLSHALEDNKINDASEVSFERENVVLYA